ncbi:MAG: TIGR02266 family protein [Deltaproteobacteria bacterium]|nr:TIGR02266 family protein [Deltaproteobacteria bacterium]
MSSYLQRDPRVPKALAVTYEDGPSAVKAYGKDISPGGVFIDARNPLEQGRRFSLDLQLPGHLNPIHAEGEVAWARKPGEGAGEVPPGMGVRFLAMSEEDRGILDQYVRTLEALGIRVPRLSPKDSEILSQYLADVRKGRAGD